MLRGEAFPTLMREVWLGNSVCKRWWGCTPWGPKSCTSNEKALYYQYPSQWGKQEHSVSDNQNHIVRKTEPKCYEVDLFKLSLMGNVCFCELSSYILSWEITVFLTWLTLRFLINLALTKSTNFMINLIKFLTIYKCQMKNIYLIENKKIPN